MNSGTLCGMATFSHDMVIIHRVFRREFAIMPGIVRGTAAGDAGRAALLADHLQLLLDVLDHHHEGEDLLLWPRLRDRAPGRAALFDAMDGDHRTLHADLARLHDLVATWRATASDDDRDALAYALDAVTPPLVAHLDHEEREVLPLVEELLSPEEWGELGQRAFGLLRPDDAMIVLAQMNEDSPDEEWAAFFTHLPPPVQAAYTAHDAYPAYVTSVRG